LVAKAFSRGWIDDGSLAFEDFAQELRDAEEARDPMASFTDRFYLLTEFDDVITLMKNWHTFRLPEEEPTAPSPRLPPLIKTLKWSFLGFLRR
jgi:hypothetical protein